jgi:hypothetical protein|uniref:Putative RNA-directed DNA polymerase n=1 Tax=Sipha flava TaxID=143950 RepID=A0A2S2Q8K4_9HEMI
MVALNCFESSQNHPTYNSIPKKILVLTQQKHTVMCSWQQYRRPEDRRLLNALTKQVGDKLDNYRINSYKKYLSEIHPNAPNLWRCTKRLINKDYNNIPPLHITTQSAAITDEKNCELIAHNLENIFKPNDVKHQPTYNLGKNSELMEDFTVQNMFLYINPIEIKNNIKLLPHRKSPEVDQITNQMLKKLPNKAITYLTNLFNSLHHIGYYPIGWKKAIIVLLSKPGKDKSNPDNYRLISLLTTLSKFFEKSVQNRLLKYLNSIETKLKFQFGFKGHYSTNEQLLRLTESINNGFEKKTTQVQFF